jgi:hypothetical protein
MIDARETIWNAIVPLAKARGFRMERATNAYISSDETSSVFNLQRSQWGQQYYLNCGIWLNRFGFVKKPREHVCHIRWRVISLLSDDDARLLEGALNIERPIDDAARRFVFAKTVDVYGLGLLAECTSESAVMAMLSRYPDAAFAVRRELKERVG